MGVKPLRTTYQVKITLRNFRPPIWRRLLVPSNISLNVFHLAIQYSMGWLDCHLHHFEKDRNLYGIPDDEFTEGIGITIKDERRYKLSQVLRKEKDWLDYEYDFGDGWGHKVILEKILPYDKDIPRARCIKGKRACPPENCGGTWGYRDFLKIIRDPSHPEYEETSEWLGGEFDPDYFDLEEINEMLSENAK